jgi:hypothetical protein
MVARDGAVIAAPPTPGLLAPRPEKELHKALIQKKDNSQFEQIARRYPTPGTLGFSVD